MPCEESFTDQSNMRRHFYNKMNIFKLNNINIIAIIFIFKIKTKPETLKRIRKRVICRICYNKSTEIS